jgi:hypothetical protein
VPRVGQVSGSLEDFRAFFFGRRQAHLEAAGGDLHNLGAGRAVPDSSAGALGVRDGVPASIAMHAVASNMRMFLILISVSAEVGYGNGVRQ